MSCPHCGNTMGFVCGTCCECGYNRIDGQFRHIHVYVDDAIMQILEYLQPELYEALILSHKYRTKDKYK